MFFSETIEMPDVYFLLYQSLIKKVLQGKIRIKMMLFVIYLYRILQENEIM